MASPRASKGFTLIELVVALVVSSILIAIAVPSFKTLLANQRLQSVTSDLAFALMQARSEASKRSTQVRIEALDGKWENGWELYTADNQLLDAHEGIVGVKFTASVTQIAYQRSGRLVVGTAPTIEAVSADDSSLKRCLSVDLSGRPYTKATQC